MLKVNNNNRKLFNSIQTENTNTNNNNNNNKNKKI